MFNRALSTQNLNNVVKQKPLREGSPDKSSSANRPADETDEPAWAWIVVLGSFFIHVLIDGLAYTFGVYTTDLVEHYGISRQSVGWINSALVGLTFIYGLLSY